MTNKKNQQKNPTKIPIQQKIYIYGSTNTSNECRYRRSLFASLTTPFTGVCAFARTRRRGTTPQRSHGSRGGVHWAGARGRAGEMPIFPSLLLGVYCVELRQPEERTRNRVGSRVRKKKTRTVQLIYSRACQPPPPPSFHPPSPTLPLVSSCSVFPAAHTF